MSNRIAYSPSNPCPVCGASKNVKCSATHASDGVGLFYRCRGDRPSNDYQLFKEGTNGFRFYRRTDDVDRARQYHRDRIVCGAAREPAQPKRPTATRPATDWAALASSYVPHLTGDLKYELAARLGLPGSVLDHFPQIGYEPNGVCLINGSPVEKGTWTFPQTDGAGNVVGIEHRHRRELLSSGQSDKMSAPGCNRGLFAPKNWRDLPGPLLLVEGASGTMACVAAGLPAIGRPGNSQGAEQIVELLRDVPADRDVIIVCDNDPKKDGSRPGLEGGSKVAAFVAEKTGRRVLRAMLPDGVKDSREFLRDATEGEEQRWAGVPWAERGVRLREYLIGNAAEVGGAPEKIACSPVYAALSGVAARSYCSCCESFECPEPSVSTRQCGARASISNAEQDAVGIHARALIADIIGDPPKDRPCRFPRNKLRDGSHPTTIGTFDLLKVNCGKCGACQDKRRYSEKSLHCRAALAIGTHIYHQNHEADWHALRAKLDRLRKRIDRSKPFPFARCIQADGRRFVVLSLTDVDPNLIPVELVAAPAEQCARLMAAAIDAIPYKLPKNTTRIQSNAVWKVAGGYVKPEKQESLYTDLGGVEPQEGEHFEDVEAAAIACEAVEEVVHAPLPSSRVDARIILRYKPDCEHEVFRHLFKGSLAQLRTAAAERRSVMSGRRNDPSERERQRTERRIARQLAPAWRDLREHYRGREHEATGLMADLLA